MGYPDFSGNPYQSPRSRAGADPTFAQPKGPRLSCKRVLKLLVCVLSSLWLVLGHVVVPFEGGFRAPLRVLLRNGFIDLAAMLTIFFCVPRRWRYFLGPLFLLLAIVILWNLWSLRSLPWDSLPGIPK
jgi:hypothetical protein